MDLVILLRAVNVGGHKVFKPSTLPGILPDLDMVSIGAAGTYVVRDARDKASVRAAIEDVLPVDAPMAIVDGAKVRDLLEHHGVTAGSPDPGAKAEVTTLLEPATQPLAVGSRWPPEGREEVRVVHVDDRFVVTWRWPGGRLSPYKVIEKATGAAGTTRTWATFARLVGKLG